MTRHARLNGRCQDKNGKPISFGSAFPELLKEWDYNMNDRSPYTLGRSSRYDASWICSQGHQYQAKIVNRTMRGDGCPFCSGKRVKPGFNDLTVKCPDLIIEWSPKNDLSPLDVTPGSNKKVWWICRNCGHEWEALISNRSRGSGCPNCRYKNAADTRHKTLLNTRETFAKACPELLKEWDYYRNKDIADPEKITKSSGLAVHWRCPNCNHHWTATINNRSRNHGHCPNCAFGSKTRRYTHKNAQSARAKM